MHKLKKNDYTTSITILRKRLNWLTTTKQIDFKMLSILYKTIHTNIAHELRSIITIKHITQQSVATFKRKLKDIFNNQ